MGGRKQRYSAPLSIIGRDQHHRPYFKLKNYHEYLILSFPLGRITLFHMNMGDKTIKGSLIKEQQNLEDLELNKWKAQSEKGEFDGFPN